MAGTTAWVHVSAAGMRVASIPSVGATIYASATLYYHRDRLGSVVATTTAGGVKGAVYRYDTYGNLAPGNGETTANASEL